MTTRRSTMVWALGVAVFCVTGCDDEPGDRSSQPREAARAPSDPGLQAPRSWSVAREPLLVIGQNAERPGHALDGVDGATRLSDGRVVVADGSSEIKFYSEDGELLSVAGGEGEGPEEITRGIGSFARGKGDTTLVLSGDWRLSVVSPDAEIVSKRGIGWTPLRLECHMTQQKDIVLAPDHSLVVQAGAEGRRGCPPTGQQGRHRRTDILGRLQPSDSDLDTIATLPGTERDGGGFALFGRALAVAMSGQRIFAGDTGGDSIVVFSLDGTREEVWTVPLEARTTPEDVPMPVNPPRRLRDGRMMAGGALSLERDSVYPRFARLLADRVGHLWIMSYPEFQEPVDAYRLKSLSMWTVGPDGAVWTVVDPRGQVVGTVRTPPDLYVLEIGDDYVLGLHRDELDVESVRLYALAR